MQTITPFIWFEKNADDAARFYVSVFKRYKKDSKMISSTKLEDTPSGPNTYTIALVLDGTRFTFINGGKVPGYKLSASGAVSFVINCRNQKEIDHFWNGLVRGGKPIQCGWLRDKFGVTWQVVPTALPKLLGGLRPGGRAPRSAGDAQDEEVRHREAGESIQREVTTARPRSC